MRPASSLAVPFEPQDAVNAATTTSRLTPAARTRALISTALCVPSVPLTKSIVGGDARYKLFDSTRRDQVTGASSEKARRSGAGSPP